MKKSLILVLAISAALLSMAMARKAQYDEEARAAEKQAKNAAPKYEAPSPGEAAKRFVGGIKEATVDSTRSLIGETADSAKGAPVVGTLEGAREGSGTALDHAVKGTVKVATLGYAEVDKYEVEEPESGSGDPTKITFKLPGT